MNTNLSITYSLTQGDFKEFTKRVLALAIDRHKQKNRYITILAWFGLVAFFFVLFRVADDFDLKAMLPGLLIAAAVITSFILLLMRNARLMKPVDAGYALGQRTITISETGIEEHGQSYHHKRDWNGVTLVDETKQHLFLFVDNNAALIIPRRIFSSHEQYQQFHNKIAALHQ